MSPTILRFANLRVVIYTKDHKPAHIHDIGPNAELVMDLATWQVVRVVGFTEMAVNRIRRFLRERGPQFWEAWNEIHKVEKE